MSEQTYVFSCYSTRPVARIVRRPWWAFWRHDTLVTEPQRVRLCFMGIPQDEADLLMDGHLGSTPAQRLFLRACGPDAAYAQLEHAPTATPYFTTNCVETGQPEA